MNSHATAFLYKFLFIAAIHLLVLVPMAGATFSQALLVALVNTALLYVLGDLFVLPNFGNWTAIIGDMGVALLVAWLAPLYTGLTDVNFGTAFSIAVLVGIAEYFFHRALLRDLLRPHTAR